MFTLDDYDNCRRNMGKYDLIDISFHEDGKLRVNGEVASDALTERLMNHPITRSLAEQLIGMFPQPEHKKVRKAITRLLRKYA